MRARFCRETSGATEIPFAPGAKLDTKEVSVWKLADMVFKPYCKNWQDGVDLQSAAIHGFVYPDLVLAKVKRLTTEVTPESLRAVIDEINQEHADKAGPPGPPGISSELNHWKRTLIDPAKWDFIEMHTKTISIENKNGLEMYRPICNIIDAVSETYHFHLNSKLIAMPQIYGDQIKSLKELYAFRLFLNSKVVAYNNATGSGPDHAQFKQHRLCVHGHGIKELAAQSGLDQEAYSEICEDIDRRYRLEYEGLVVAKSAKGDEPKCPTTIPELKVGKGKWKGWGSKGWNPKGGKVRSNDGKRQRWKRSVRTWRNGPARLESVGPTRMGPARVESGWQPIGQLWIRRRIPQITWLSRRPHAEGRG